jgi:hypothetical protein
METKIGVYFSSLLKENGIIVHYFEKSVSLQKCGYLPEHPEYARVQT